MTNVLVTVDDFNQLTQNFIVNLFTVKVMEQMNDHLLAIRVNHSVGENTHIQPTTFPFFGLYMNILVRNGFRLLCQFHYLTFRLANQMSALIITVQKMKAELTSYINLLNFSRC